MSFYTGDSNEYIMGDIRILRASSEPCIICGQVGGNCVGEQSPPEHVLLHGTTPSLEQSQGIYVEEDIYSERQIGGLTTVKFLVARKGSTISFQKAKELGII